MNTNERYLINFGDIIERMSKLFVTAEDLRLALRFKAGWRPEHEVARIVAPWVNESDDTFGFDLTLASPADPDRVLVRIRLLADPTELDNPTVEGARIGFRFFVMKIGFAQKIYPPAAELAAHINETVAVLEQTLYEACRQLTSEQKLHG